jgi:excisionase family DNA binding protein
MPTKHEPLMIDLIEVRKYLPLGRNKIYEMAKDGTLPGVRKFGGRYLVSRAELLHYLGRDDLVAAPEADQPRHYMTTGEVAEIVGCSIRTVIRHIDNGRIPAIRPMGPGTRRRIPFHDALDVIAQLKNDPAKATQRHN